MQQSQIHKLFCCIIFSLGFQVLLAQPTVDLGPDTVVCGSSLMLDAGNAGATYSWSTGETSQTITVSTSDFYWVDVTNGGTTRDSIKVDFVTPPTDPVLVDTTLCGTDALSVSGTHNGDFLIWYDAFPNGEIIGVGDTLTISASSSTTIYAQSTSPAPCSNVGYQNPSALSYDLSTRGIRFNVFDDLIIKSVRVYCDQPTTFDLEINQGGAPLYTKQFFLPMAGEHQLFLFVNLPVGNNYRMLGRNINGKLANTTANLNYPYIVPGKINIFGDQNASTSIYRYFFDLEITDAVCTSNAMPLNINILPSPVVELGNDTVQCEGTVLLDATNANATYSWSTGAVSPTVSISSSDTVSVFVDINGCTAVDTVEIEILDNPSDPILPDTTLCQDPNLVLDAAFTADNIIWYDDAGGNNIIGTGNPFAVDILTSTTLYMQTYNHSTYFETGLIGPNPAALLYNPDLRGLIFDVEQDLILETITVYSDQATTFDLEIEDNQGTAIYSQSFTLSDAGQYDLPLFASIPAGDNYKILGKNIVGGLGVSSGGITYPFEVPGLIRIKGDQSNNTNVYRYFYHFRVFKALCESSIIPVDINILPTPQIDLGNDSVICGNGPVILDATNPGASYLWSTNETTSSIQVDTSGLFVVNASINTCSVIDSVMLEFVDTPGTPVVSDLTICSTDTLTLTATANAQKIFWFGQAVGGPLLATGDLTVRVNDTVTYYAQGINSSSTAQVGITPNSTANFSNSKRGFRFDVMQDLILQTVEVIISDTSSFTVELLNSSGTVIDSVVFTDLFPVVDGGGSFLAQTIPLYLDIPKGDDYRILVDIEQGQMGFDQNNPTYPYTVPGQISILGDQNLGQTRFYYLFNWKISRLICESPRVPLTVEVELPWLLEDSIYSCTPLVVDPGNLQGTFLWSTGETTQTILVDSTDFYVLTVSNTNNCTITDSVFVEIPTDAGLADDGILCGNTLFTNYDTTATFLWSDNSTADTLFVNQPGVYSVTVNEPRGCTLSDTITITGFDTFPIVDLGEDFATCDSAILDAGNPGLSFQWSTLDTTQTISINSSGTYFVNVTNENGCSTTDTIGVAVTPSPTASFSLPDTLVNSGLQVNFINLSSFGTYLWDFGDGNSSIQTNPIHFYSDTGTYCVELIVTDILGNCGTDTIQRCFTLLEFNVGLEVETSLQFNTYPNPVQEKLMIELPTEGIQDLRLHVIDPTGRRIETHFFEGNQRGVLELSTSNWTTGIYLLQFQDGNGQAGFQKIIKE